MDYMLLIPCILAGLLPIPSALSWGDQIANESYECNTPEDLHISVKG